MPDEQSGVWVSPREIYDAVIKLHGDVADTRAEVVELKASIVTSSDLTKRVRSLEMKFYGILAGVVGGVVAIIGLVLKISIGS